MDISVKLFLSICNEYTYCVILYEFIYNKMKFLIKQGCWYKIEWYKVEYKNRIFFEIVGDIKNHGSSL